jgi:hypothetical protein
MRATLLVMQGVSAAMRSKVWTYRAWRRTLGRTWLAISEIFSPKEEKWVHQVRINSGVRGPCGPARQLPLPLVGRLVL